MPSLYARQTPFDNCDGYVRNNRCYRNGSNWDSYGRWVVVAVLIGAGFMIFFLFACITARRRRRAGAIPYRGTGWAGGRPPPGHGPPQNFGPNGPQPYYGGNQFNQQPPPAAAPPYSPANQGYYNNNTANPGYFGGQQTGVELQPPQNAYQPQRGGDAVYEPPPGPPPNKGGDGVIR